MSRATWGRACGHKSQKSITLGLKTEENDLEYNKERGVTHLEGLDEGPQQITDALWAVEELDQTHDTEESEESDGNWGIF